MYQPLNRFVIYSSDTWSNQYASDFLLSEVRESFGLWDFPLVGSGRQSCLIQEFAILIHSVKGIRVAIVDVRECAACGGDPVGGGCTERY